MSAIPREQRSLGDLFSELADESKRLIREEVELAKVEMSHKAALMGRNAAMVAVGALLAYVGLLALVASLIVGLGHKVGFGTSALIVGIVIAIAGGVVATMGVDQLKKNSLAPKETVQQIQETKQWAARQV